MQCSISDMLNKWLAGIQLLILGLSIEWLRKLDFFEILKKKKCELHRDQSRTKAIEPSANWVWKCRKEVCMGFHETSRRYIKQEGREVPLGVNKEIMLLRPSTIV